MAQWIGQFTGHTHATKVTDAEEELREIIISFHKADPLNRRRKAKSVKNLAERLLTIRLKFLKALLDTLEPASSEDVDPTAKRIAIVRAVEAKTRTEGLKGILAEFRALEALDCGPTEPQNENPIGSNYSKPKS